MRSNVNPLIFTHDIFFHRSKFSSLLSKIHFCTTVIRVLSKEGGIRGASPQGSQLDPPPPPQTGQLHHLKTVIQFSISNQNSHKPNLTSYSFSATPNQLHKILDGTVVMLESLFVCFGGGDFLSQLLLHLVTVFINEN